MISMIREGESLTWRLVLHFCLLELGKIRVSKLFGETELCYMASWICPELSKDIGFRFYFEIFQECYSFIKMLLKKVFK